MGKSKKIADEWIDRIAGRVKELRKAKGFSSYDDFADEYEMDRKQYWRIEKGSNITLRTLIKVLEIHGKDLPTFFKEIDAIKKNASK